MTAIILAGGKASRMNGCSKAFLRINNEPLIKRQLRLLKKIFKQIIIVTNSPKEYRNFRGVKVVSDVVLHQGPLGGIYSGLLVSKSFYNFVVACDMPFINPSLIRYMYKNKSGYDVIVSRVNNQYEPLFCIYSKRCLKYIKLLLDEKIFRIRKFFPKVKVREITKQEVLQFGLPEKIFMNIDTPKDLNKLSHE